jgi:chemotaxis protein CheX
VKKNGSIEEILSAIVYRAELFLRDEMEIENRFEGTFRSVNKIELRKYTTMIGIGGSLNFLFYTTYDETLLDILTKRFAFGTIDDDEFSALRESAAGEIANTVVGHSIGDFPNRGNGVTLTPPATIEDAKSILKTNGTDMINALLRTSYGNIEFNLIGSLKGEKDA